MPGEIHERRDGWDGCGSQRGQTMAEYAIVTSVVTVICVAALVAFGNPVLQLIQNAADVIGSLT
jgi:Flp pilus assembly pilin Flp